jgi:iron complex outermembrane receptor protein
MHMQFNRRIGVLRLLSLLFLPAPIAAQQQGSAGLSGRVVDVDGAPVARARVTLIEAGRSVFTDSDGRYRIGGLAARDYTVVVERMGFKPSTHRLRLAEGAVLDVVLEPSVVQLPAVQVSATPLATAFLDAPQPVSSVDAASLTLRGSATLAAALERIPGVHNWSTGMGIGKPVVRGLKSNQVLVLADGQRLETQQWGDEHGSNAEFSQAERIEIVRGPASVLYGSDALGGAINIVSPELPDAIGRSGFVRSRWSAGWTTGNDQPEGSLGLEGAAGGLGWRLGLVGRRAGDVRTPRGRVFNSGYAMLNGSASVGYQGRAGLFRVDYVHRREDVEIHEDPAEDPLATPLQKIEDDRVRLAWESRGGQWRFDIRTGFQRNHRREFEERDAVEVGEVAVGLISDTYTGEFHAHHPRAGSWEGTVGIAVLATEVSRFGEEALVPGSLSRSAGIFAFEQATIGRTTIGLGARLDYRHLRVDADPELGIPTTTRSWTSVTGNAGLSHRIGRDASVVLSAGRGYRVPSAFELFVNGEHEGTRRFEIGNPDLKSEVSWNLDLSLRWASRRTQGELGGFFNLVDGLIFPSPTGRLDPEENLPIFEIAQGDATLAGFEAAVEFRPVAWLTLEGHGDYVWAQNRSTSEPLPDIPPLSGAVEAELRPVLSRIVFPYFRAGLEGAARQTRLAPFDVATDGYLVANAGWGVAFTLSGAAVRVDALLHNVFNRSYVKFLSRYKRYEVVPLEMGRSLRVQVTVE